MAYLGHVLKWSLLRLLCWQGPRDSEYGMPECMMWIPFVWAGSSQALANSFRRASFESLLFSHVQMYPIEDASSMRCRHWCCGIISAYLGHVLNWSLLHLLCARTT